MMDINLTDLTIEITQSCPNQCIFCSSFAVLNSTHSITPEEVKKIGVEAVELGLKEISISGGEPLFHPDIDKIVSILADLGLEVSIYTIGQHRNLAGEISAFKDWQIFKKNDPKVIFNIQSTDPEIHDFLVARKGSFQMTYSSLQSAINEGMNVEVHLVPNKTNISTIEQTTNDLVKLGVSKISFLRLVPQGYAKTHMSKLEMSKDNLVELKKVFLKLDSKHKEYANLRFGIPFSSMLNDTKECNAGRHKLIIRYDGKVLPCEAFKDSGKEEYVLGDIRTGSLSQMLLKGSSHVSLNSIKQQSKCQCESCPAQLIY